MSFHRTFENPLQNLLREAGFIVIKYPSGCKKLVSDFLGVRIHSYAMGELMAFILKESCKLAKFDRDFCIDTFSADFESMRIIDEGEGMVVVTFSGIAFKS